MFSATAIRRPTITTRALLALFATSALIIAGLSLAHPVLASDEQACLSGTREAVRDALKIGSDIDGPQHQDGSTATTLHAALVIPDECGPIKVSFSSYALPGGMMVPYPDQVEFDNITATYEPGTYSLTINLPACRWQADLYIGDNLATLEHTGYGHPAQDLIDWAANEGTPCEPTPTETPTPTPAPTETPAPTSTPEGSFEAATGTPAPSGTPESSVKAATGTPAPSVPNTAVGGTGGNPQSPIALFGLLLLVSLASMVIPIAKHVLRRS